MYHICSETSTFAYMYVPCSQRHDTFVNKRDRSDNRNCGACVCVCVCVFVCEVVLCVGCCVCVCVCVWMGVCVRVSCMIIGRTVHCMCE